MNDEELDQQTIALYEAEVARWEACGRRLLRFAARLSLALAAVAVFMYVTNLIESIR